MKRAVLLVMAVCVGGGLVQRFLQAQQEPAKEHLTAEFRKYDRDNDGRVTAEELRMPRLFALLDADKDGAVTLDETLRGFRDNPKAVREASDADKAGAKPSDKPESTASDVDIRRGPKPLRAVDRGVGRLIPDASFKDIAGRSMKLSDLFADRSTKAVVIAVTSTSCPLSQKFLPTLAQLEKQWKAKGIAFVFVNPMPSDKRSEMEEAVKANGLSGPYVADESGSLAQLAGATTTTDAIVIDAARTVVYHGAVDDQYGFGYAIEEPRVRYLNQALEAVTSGSRLVTVATDAPGCELDLKASASDAVASATWHNRISRIVQQHCEECHRDGGVAPFALTSFADMTAHKAMIKQVLERRVMPPWFAVDAKDQPARWSNDRSVPEEDRATLFAWLSNGSPEGDAADAPLPRQWADGWIIGKPDAIVQLPQPVSIKATGTMPYQNLSVKTDFAEDRWVRGFEIQPTDRAVVHHVLVFVDSSDDPDRGESDERRGFLAAYVPGNSYVMYPEGFAKRLPKGATLQFQMHYTPAGKATQDQTKLGLIFADQPPEHEVKVHGIADVRLDIPPGAANHEESTSLRLPSDVELVAFMPHMHVRGKAFRYEAELPDGSRKTLLDVPRYDFNWQFAYRLNEPQLLPAGSTIRVTAWYDNSDRNPANPDPKKTVHWGPQTYDEMMIGYVEFFVPGAAPGSANPLGPRARVAGLVGDLFRQLDADQNGAVSRAEAQKLTQSIPRLKDNPALLELAFKRLDQNKSGALEKAEFDRLPQMLQRSR